MANPQETTCTKDVWTKVATGVTSGTVFIKDSSDPVLHIYKKTGDAAPTAKEEGAIFGGLSHIFNTLESVDIYVLPRNNDAIVRFDSTGLPGGTEPGYSVVNKFGVNLDIDTGTTPETIWSHGGAFPFLSAGIAMDFVSSVAADDLLGTGAQIIRVTFYDDSNTEFVQDFDTDGVTPVQLPGVVKIVTRAQVIQAGTGLTNAGKISFVNRGGAIVYQSIDIGEGQTLSTPQIVPAGKKGLIKRIEVGYARAGAAFNNADMSFKIRLANGTIVTKFPVVISANLPEKIKDYNFGGVEMAEGDIAFWECTTVSANDTPIEAAFDLELTDA